MLQIQDPKQRPSSPHPILNLGFRIFFSGGAVFAVLIMLVWSLVFMGKTDIDVQHINPLYWHAHEMLFGYALAIIAGFLLTSVKTWTGIMMPYGYRLLWIFGCWALARTAWLMLGLGMGSTLFWLMVAMCADLLFMLSMAIPIIKAVLAVKQYRQMGLVSKLVLLTIANGLCYWGLLAPLFAQNNSLEASGTQDSLRIGVYLGLYLVIGVVLTIGRRVVPFFIERGLSVGSDKTVVVKNSKWLDGLSLLSFLIFMIADVFYPNPTLISLSALTVAVINTIRLVGWHQRQLWQKPLLWSLFIAFLGMCIAFFIFAASPWLHTDIPNIHSIAVHALALSGVGMMTVAMMSRVSLGHTGRSIHTPPKTLPIIFGLMILAFVCRVILPLIDFEHYLIWIMIAQTAWIACFALFCITYLPMLAAPRPDNLFG